MHIAYVCADRGVPVFGRKGASIHVQEVLRALRRRGAQVTLLAARRGGHPPAGLDPVRVEGLAGTAPAAPGDRAGAERSLIDADALLPARLESAGPFDLVYERHALFSCAAMEFARRAGVPSILEVNAPLLEEQQRYRHLALVTEARIMADRAFAAADSIVAVSEAVASWLHHRPAAAGRVHVVPNGVDPARFPVGIAPALPGPPGVTTVGFVGTLKPWHGVESLIDSVATIARQGRRLRLLIVGDGPLRGALEARAAGAGLEPGRRAVFSGAVDHGEVPALLASMDIAVAPYPPMEDFYFSPLKLYEYMAAGRAIVASAAGQVRGVIEGGATGLLYEPGDGAALGAALRQLIDDPGLRARLGSAARLAACRRHTWDAAVGRILMLAGIESRMGPVVAQGSR